MLNKILKSIINNSIKKINFGSIKITYPDKHFYKCGDGNDYAELEIHSWKAIWLCITKGDIGLAESYFKNYLSTPDISKLMIFFSYNLNEIKTIAGGRKYLKMFYHLKHALNKNTVKGSKNNIQAHYDLGNDFYSLWLDRTMTYSSALFDDQKISLSEAQEMKYQKIIDSLELKSGDHILDIGCGWGGFMEYAASKGYNVTGITISDEQYNFSKKRLKKYISNTNVIKKDYRELDMKFDAVVSIEMFEAVGKEFWKSYFLKIKSFLKPNKKALIQTITIDNKYFNFYENNIDFIQSYIFPGGMMASEHKLEMITNNCNLTMIKKRSFAQDYAKTLDLWHEQFLTNWEKISNLGFNGRFKKIWSFYLMYCKAGFLSKRINVSHFTIS